MISYVFMKILESRPHSYDKRINAISRGQVYAIKEEIARLIPAGSRVLEPGCGSGELAVMLANSGSEVEGFDLNPGMVAAAQNRIEAEGLHENFQVRQMGVEGMDRYPSDSFDVVVATLVFSELNEDEQQYALKQALRILKPGGLIIIADEVVPHSMTHRMKYRIARAPLLVITYLATGKTTQPLTDPSRILAKAGFSVESEKRSQDAFALVVAKKLPVEKQP